LWLLNTPDGVVMLRTGILRAHRREDYCTKLTAVSPEGECPRWLSMLNYIFAGDAELIAFTQRFAGYCLTGSTRDQILVFGYGTGGNGKGVFTNTLSAVLGDYAVTAPMETFMASNGERHPADLAMLRGARLVTAQETDEGRHWAEGKIKTLTGGDPVTARFMRQDFFTFTPQFKLLVAGNHRPSLRGVDEAIRRRFLLVPFTVTVSAERRDPHLFESLKEEWPGILAWMVEGCRQWAEGGLKPPSTVLEATAKYLESEDAFRLWFDDCCESAASQWESSADLFQSWKEWAERSGEPVGSQKRFAQILESNGYLPKRATGGRRGFSGLLRRRRDYSEDRRDGQ